MEARHHRGPCQPRCRSRNHDGSAHQDPARPPGSRPDCARWPRTADPTRCASRRWRSPSGLPAGASTVSSRTVAPCSRRCSTRGSDPRSTRSSSRSSAGAATHARRCGERARSRSARSLLPIDLAIRDWARHDPDVAVRLRRVDNRRMEYLRQLFGSFCADEDGDRRPSGACVLPCHRLPLHRRRPRITQPPRSARARRPPAARLTARPSGGWRSRPTVRW